MDEITPAAQRHALALQHQAAHTAAPTRNARQQVRLRLLRAWGRRYPRPAATHPPRRILLIRPDHLGDLLFTTPMLHVLRQSLPEAQITALTGPWGQAVLANTPDLDALLTCPFPGFTRTAQDNPLAPYRLLREEARRLAGLSFDLALILRFDHWWGAWLAAAAGIPQRVGYAVAEVQPFLTHAVPYRAGRHEVLQNLALALAATGRTLPAAETDAPPLRFVIPAAAEGAAARLLPDDGRPVVALHPGSGAAVKRWRTAGWVELANWLVQARGARVVFTGSTGEAALIEPVLAALPAGTARSLAGQTDLDTLAALYRRCALVIGPDSGPLHLAVAVGAPTLHLYGPGDQRTFGPWGNPQRHRVLVSDWACIPCNRLDWPAAALPEHGCVRDIAASQVIAAAARLLDAV